MVPYESPHTPSTEAVFVLMFLKKDSHSGTDKNPAAKVTSAGK